MSKKNQEVETKSVAVVENNTALSQVVSTQEAMDDFGDGGLSSRDIVIPKLSLMQPSSQFVIEGKFKFKDVVHSISKDVVAMPLELVPFFVAKKWTVYKKEGTVRKFIRFETVTALNENKEYEEVTKDGTFQNMFTYDVYFINPKDPSIPVIISLRGKSQRTGKELMTQLYIKNRAEGKTPAHKIILMNPETEKNDKGTYGVWKFNVGRNTSDAEFEVARQWVKTVKNSASDIKIDTSEEVMEASSVPSEECPY